MATCSGVREVISGAVASTGKSCNGGVFVAVEGCETAAEGDCFIYGESWTAFCDSCVVSFEGNSCVLTEVCASTLRSRGDRTQLCECEGDGNSTGVSSCMSGRALVSGVASTVSRADDGKATGSGNDDEDGEGSGDDVGNAGEASFVTFFEAVATCCVVSYGVAASCLKVCKVCKVCGCKWYEDGCGWCGGGGDGNDGDGKWGAAVCTGRSSELRGWRERFASELAMKSARVVEADGVVCKGRGESMT